MKKFLIASHSLSLMTSLTFYGGVDEIGGNKFLVRDRGTTVFMDFGMSFFEEGRFFSPYMKARGSSTLTDLFELGILPRIRGLYRRDYARHEGFGGDEDNEIDAVLLTHAHLDHCGYISYLREDIPVYCSEESRLIMKSFDDTGGPPSQYLTLKEKFRIHEGSKGKMVRTKGTQTEIPRDIRLFKPGEEFEIDSMTVKPMPVDHSIPGTHAFILHTSGGTHREHRGPEVPWTEGWRYRKIRQRVRATVPGLPSVRGDQGGCGAVARRV